MITIWKEFPIATVMYLAGLQAIPLELYEAAEVDGANNIRKFFHITLPQLKPVNTIVILLLIIWGLKRVTAIYVLTKGGPAMATQTLVIQSYLNAFSFFKMSYAATIGTFMLVFSLIISIVYLKLTLGRSS
jgi:multiple sugar transport system permease protein